VQKLPLEGYRVLDLSTWWAGPLGTMILGGLGAEVIKIEAIQRLDGYRGTYSGALSSKTYETSPAFNTVNRNKLGITLNLDSAKGVQIFRELVKISDVVYENYSARVMEAFGLDYPSLQKINPSIIMVSVTGFGRTGPWRDYVSFAATSESMAGLPEITGYPGGPPIIPGAILADPLSGVYAALATLAALHARGRTGRGQLVDLSLLETTSTVLGDVLIDHLMNGRLPVRQGNRHPRFAPHDVYRCQGEDQWVAIAIRSDEEWRRFCQTLDRPELANDSRFAGVRSRWQNQDALKPVIEEWTIKRSKEAACRLLQKQGIAAGGVASAKDLLRDPHLKARGFFQRIHRQEVGMHPYPSLPMRSSQQPYPMGRPAPLLGEHNQYVLGELLGMTQDQIEELVREQVIGTEPLNLPPAR